MTAMVAYFLLAVVGVASIAASLSTIKVMSKLSAQPETPQEPDARTQAIDLNDQYEVRAEAIFMPTAGDWGESIQRQLEKIEDLDPTAELVSVASMTNRIVLFYKVRKSR